MSNGITAGAQGARFGSPPPASGHLALCPPVAGTSAPHPGPEGAAAAAPPAHPPALPPAPSSLASPEPGEEPRAELAAVIALEIARALARSGDVLTVRQARAIGTGIARACGLEEPLQDEEAAITSVTAAVKGAADALRRAANVAAADLPFTLAASLRPALVGALGHVAAVDEVIAQELEVWRASREAAAASAAPADA